MVGPKVLVGVPQETVERFSQKLRFIYSLRGVDFATLLATIVWHFLSQKTPFRVRIIAK